MPTWQKLSKSWWCRTFWNSRQTKLGYRAAKQRERLDVILLDGSVVDVLSDIKVIRCYMCWDTIAFRFPTLHSLEKVFWIYSTHELPIAYKKVARIFPQKNMYFALYYLYFLLNLEFQINSFAVVQIFKHQLNLWKQSNKLRLLWAIYLHYLKHWSLKLTSEGKTK